MTRLTRENWVDSGLESLKKKGFTSLKADLLAKDLKVSRGSFYWHFTDVGAFHDAVLDAWVTRSAQIAQAVDRTTNAHTQLQGLMTAAMQADHGLERAFRAWALSAPKVAAVIHNLDKFRIEELTRILMVALDDPEEAARRAKLLYAAAIGMPEIGTDQPLLDEADVIALANFIAQ